MVFHRRFPSYQGVDRPNVLTATQKTCPTRVNGTEGRSHITSIGYRQVRLPLHTKPVINPVEFVVTHTPLAWCGKFQWTKLAPAEIFTSGVSAQVCNKVQQLSSRDSKFDLDAVKIVVACCSVREQ